MTISPFPKTGHKPTVELEPVNLHNTDDFEELLKQRVLCGWDNKPTYLMIWKDAIDRGEKALFWIHLLPSLSTEAASNALEDQGSGGYRKIGHIGFQSVPDRGGPDSDLELANTDKSVLMISTFFIYQEHRGGGIGRAAMAALEAMTQVAPYGSPKCRTLTLTTLSRVYTDDDGDGSPEAWRTSRGVGEKLDEPPRVKGSSNEDWYQRMGYTKWKEEPRYEHRTPGGVDIKFLAAFMRKEL